MTTRWRQYQFMAIYLNRKWVTGSEKITFDRKIDPLARFWGRMIYINIDLKE